jgi:hypothetical protein
VQRKQGSAVLAGQALCEQAASEQDPQKLMELAHEIDRLLEAKEQRLKGQRTNTLQGA